MRNLLLAILVLIAMSSCIRLDSNLFRPNPNITEYQWENYEGRTGFDPLPEELKIADEQLHVFTLISDDNGDQAEIYALYIGDIFQIAVDTVILYCHGNSTHMDAYYPRVKMLANLGQKHRFGVMMVDYRGFGLSGGEPTESGLYADVDAAMQWLKGQGLTDDRLIIYGFSLGSAPATELTANPRTLTPMKLMLEAPFASSAVMVNDASRLSLPAIYFTHNVIDNAEEIKKVQQPFFWIHGVDDGFLAMKTHGEIVYKNYRGEYSEAHRIEGAGHGSVPQTMGTEAYMEAVLKFIEM